MNPYQVTNPELPQENATNKLPGFIKGWVITDLVFTSLRILILPLSIMACFVLADEDPLKATALPEVITGIVLIAIGLSSNIAILRKKCIGYTLGKINVIITLLSFILVFIQTSIQTDVIEDNTQLYAHMVGVAIALFIRVLLVSFYGFAVKKYGKFIASDDAVATELTDPVIDSGYNEPTESTDQ